MGAGPGLEHIRRVIHTLRSEATRNASVPRSQTVRLGAGGGHVRLLRTISAAHHRRRATRSRSRRKAWYEAYTAHPPTRAPTAKCRRGRLPRPDRGNLFEIDRAANDSSIVFALEWRGWRLLFAGDAEIRSWKTMNRGGVLKPVHFLKVSHHGSHNSTPADDLFEEILPTAPPDNRPRQVVISAWDDTYPGIPHPLTNNRLGERATVHSTLDQRDDLFYEVRFPWLSERRLT